MWRIQFSNGIYALVTETAKVYMETQQDSAEKLEFVPELLQITTFLSTAFESATPTPEIGTDDPTQVNWAYIS